ncbi:hypothetical protein ACJJTC_017254 [Scirpophaga incertulas]
MRITLDHSRRAPHKLPGRIHCVALIHDQKLQKELDDAYSHVANEIPESVSINEQWHAFATKLHSCASRAKRKCKKLSILEILYADDVCVMADSAEHLQDYINSLNVSCCRFGLVISVKKTEILIQPPRGCARDSTNIRLDNNILKEVFVDVLKRHLSACSMSSDRWEELALQREWRSTVHKSTKHFEQMRLEELDEKRLLSKARPKPYSYTYTNGQLHCAVCSRYFKKFGYASHIRAFHKEKLVYN